MTSRFLDVKNEFEKWRAIRANVGGVGGMLAWVISQSGRRGRRACVGNVLSWVA